LLLLTGVYTFSGGLSAVVLTDVVQLVVMFVGGAALVVLCLYEVGGIVALYDAIIAKGPEYEDHFTLLLPHDSPTPYPWTGIVFGLGIVLATAYMAGNQAVVQRTLGARSEWDAKGGMLFGAFLKSFIPLLVILPGLCAIVLVPDLENADMAVPTMIREYLPPGLTGLMFAALFAALMSSVDSYLNSSTTIWTTDLYGRVMYYARGVEIHERHGLVVGRVFTVVFIVLAGFMAPLLDGRQGMYVFIQTALSMFQGPVLAILLLGIMWKRATQWGGLAGLLLGVAFTTILHNTNGVFPSENPFLFIAWWSFVFSLAVTVIVSLLTPPEPEEKIRGLIFGQVLHDGKIQRVLEKRATQ
jgi:solute:Na+ symporter, SSS family